MPGDLGFEDVLAQLRSLKGCMHDIHVGRKAAHEEERHAEGVAREQETNAEALAKHGYWYVNVSRSPKYSALLLTKLRYRICSMENKTKSIK